ncbi:CXC domain [Phytophthora cactorum]|nr:CXC domain [Phytophthora cactorum]
MPRDDESRKRPYDSEDGEASDPSESEMEEQLCAQAAEAFNHVVRSHQIAASMEVARNRLKGSLYMIERRRKRKEFLVPPDEALQGIRAQNSADPNGNDVDGADQELRGGGRTNAEISAVFRDDDEEDVVSEFYQIKQQRTSACEVEFTKEMCEGVLKTLQSTWDLTPSDLKRVASVIQVEEEVLVEVHKNLRLSQRAAKKKRRTEAMAAANAQTNSTSTNGESDFADQANISMEEYFELYEQSVDSYRSLFCRRCCVYDCDYHGCTEQPKLNISEQNAVALNLKEKMINTGRNCGNHCFLGQMSSSSSNGFSKARAISATFGWNKQARILCARTYFLCSGNFCEMAKILGDVTCMEIAEMCAYYDINDRSLPKEVSVRIDTGRKSGLTMSSLYVATKQVRPPPKSRRSRKKKNFRMSISHLQSKCACFDRVEPCSHEGPCEPGVCSCVEDGIFCSKLCHCVHDDCKIFFPGCQCQRGRCRTKACPCYCAGRECDVDLCKVCCADEIAARENGELYDSKSDKTNIDEKQQTSCQNRSIALSKEKHVRMGRSKLSAAGWGLFVEEFVAKDEFIIEYIGEMVSQEEADRRGAVYDKVDRSYLFNLDTKTVIDSTRKGNKTRFINHSSKNPNCACKIMNVSSDFRIGLYAMHDIQPHTELFFDYGYDKELYHAELLKQPTVTEWMKK